MKTFEWNIAKNELLKKERKISFEQVIEYISQGEIIDIIEHPNSELYNNQMVIIINHNDYIYYVPYVEQDDIIFLKTIIPSRKLTKKYIGEQNEKK